MATATGLGLKMARKGLFCQAGVAAVEFALVASVLILVMVGILEVAMIMFASVLVEGGLREAARYGITGQTPDIGTREQQILGIVDKHAMGLVDLDAATVTFKVYQSFQDVEQPEPFSDQNQNDAYDLGEPFSDMNGNGMWDEDRGVEGVGNSGQVVQYKIAYDWVLFTPLIAKLIGNDGAIDMKSSIVIRNEPFEVAP